jgi:hypothetical protein
MGEGSRSLTWVPRITITILLALVMMAAKG